VARAIFALAALVSSGLAINQLLNLQLFAGVVFIENRYLFLLAASLFPLVFLAYPLQRGTGDRVPWYDWLLAAGAFLILLWFAQSSDRSLSEGWEYSAPTLAKILAGILWLMILEGLRRTSGWAMMTIVGLVSL
jgi:TRAP-type uncharacterized transport system fused permease subunit